MLLLPLIERYRSLSIIGMCKNAGKTTVLNRIVEEFDFGLVGIDFIYDEGRPVFNEIEDVVGARMLYSLTDIDIADRYLEFILERLTH